MAAILPLHEWPNRLVSLTAQALGREAPMPESGVFARITAPGMSLPHRLNALGNQLSLHFFEHELPGIDFREMLEPSMLPMIVFQRGPQGLMPLVLTQLRKDRVVYATLAGERQEGFLSELVPTLGCSGEVQHLMLSSDELVPAGPPPAPSGYVYFLNALVVESLAGSATADAVEAMEAGGDATVTSAGSDHTGSHAHEHHGPSPWKRLVYLLGSEKRDITALYIYALAVGLFSLTVPLGVQALINLVGGGLLIQPIVLLIAFVVGGMLISGALQVMQLTVVESIQQRIFGRAAFEFALRIPRWKPESLDGMYPPEQANRFFDVINVQKGMSKVLTELVTALLQVFFGLLLLTFYHPYFVFFSLVVLGILVVILGGSGQRAMKTSIEESKYKYQVAHWVQELARNLTAFKGAGETHLPMNRMDRLVAGYLKKRKAHFRVLVTQYTALLGFKVLVTGGLLVLGSILVVNRQITLGQFVATELVIVLVLGAIEKIILSLDTVYDLLTGLDKVGHVTDLPVEHSQGWQLPISMNGTGPQGTSIRARELGYHYPGAMAPALHALTFDIPSGQRVGLIGGEGSGASTLLHILAAMRQGYHGTLIYDGYSLRELNMSHLRTRIGTALESDAIFDGSIVENLTLDRPEVQPSDVRDALAAVDLTDYVEELPDGMRHHLFAEGHELSRDVAMRLVLARAIAVHPTLLLLDGMLDGLPGRLKRHILNALFDQRRHWTMLISTRDPAVLERCDRILVLERGHIHADGSWSSVQHDALVRERLTVAA